MSFHFEDDIFGLRDEQLEISRKELDELIKKDIELPPPIKKDDKIDYKYFTTSKELDNESLRRATILFISLKLTADMIEYVLEENFYTAFNLILELIDLVDKNDSDAIIDKCKLIRKITMKILERTNSVKTIVGVYKIHITLNWYLNK